MAEVAKARLRSRLTHDEIMQRMKTTRRTYARLENGREPSMRTLARFAEATGNWLNISFEPMEAKRSVR